MLWVPLFSWCCEKKSFIHTIEQSVLRYHSDCMVLCRRQAQWEVGGSDWLDWSLCNTLSPPEGLVFYYALALSAHHVLMAQGQGWMNFIGLNVGSTIRLFYPDIFLKLFDCNAGIGFGLLVEVNGDLVTCI